MKKITTLLLLIAFLFSMVSCSCNDEENTSRLTKQGMLVDYFQYGIFYSIPESFVLTNDSDGDVNYLYEDGEGYGDGYFFIEALPNEDIEEDLHENPNITVYEFAYSFFLINPMDRWEYYDDKDMAVIEADEYLFGEGDDVTPEYFRVIIVRSSECLYIVHMTCFSQNIEDFRETFDMIQESIVVQEPSATS